MNRTAGTSFLSATARAVLLFLCALPLVGAAAACRAVEPPTVGNAPKNTQQEDIPRVTATEAARTMEVPDGFQVGVFAAEPDVRQPIAMTLDPRGRLWIAENYTYAERSVNFDLQYRDRIVILEDSDGDGRADQRKVFWDQAQRLTSIEVGFGGIWALCPPNLLFLPDHDGDDVPDGEPIVMLDGWDDDDVRHNFVNGLRWGPDGWLYGRHGIMATSRVGPPGCADSERQSMNCGIWRFHPTRRQFEVVCHGTTNPWGHDWDENGQLFFINTVIGHLWHAIPGAHFERMYGEDLTPFVYELIPQTADHFHWDKANENWSDVRRAGVTKTSDQLGGGHAHSGMMIYQGDNWPDAYRGDLFTINLHGRRVNRDRLERSGATFVGQHEPDFLTVQDPWFRGLDLQTGPDGGVFMIDWSDIGECHENDGVHRTSGRVFKITHGRPPVSPAPNIAKLTNLQLVDLQSHTNNWFARQARLELQFRAIQGRTMKDAAARLHVRYESSPTVPLRLRALWCLHAIGALQPDWLRAQLNDPSEHVRLWCAKLLVESLPLSAETVAALESAARRESSPLALTFLASALQRMALSARRPLASALIAQESLQDDPVFPLMVWYGIEPMLTQRPADVAALFEASRLPRVTRLMAQRISSELEDQPKASASMTRFAAETASDAHRSAVVLGMAAGLRGWLRAKPPEHWDRLLKRIQAQGSKATRAAVGELGVVFGDGRATESLRKLVSDKSQPLESRKSALRALADGRVEGIRGLAEGLLGDRDLGATAVRALATDASPDTAKLLLAKYGRLRPTTRLVAIEVLAARPESASRLLDAVERDEVELSDIEPFVLRQMQLHQDAALSEKIGRIWPNLRLIAKDKLQQIAAYREKLETVDNADPAIGKRVFAKHCGKCHKLFGEGGSTGPELTGAQRGNLNYWLENILDPSAEVASTYRVSLLRMDDGRTLNGVVGGQGGQTLTLTTPQEQLTIDRRKIDEIRPSKMSLMPDGLLATMPDDQLRHLFAYLMAKSPPAAPGTPTATAGPESKPAQERLPH